MPQYPVLTLTNTDTLLEKEYVTQIQSVKNVELRSQASGFLEKIYVDEGQAVTKGQLLFQLNSSRYQSEVTKATALVGSAIAEMKAAEVDVNRIKILVEKNVISGTELEMARAKYKVAEAKLEEARANESNAKLLQSYTAIRAPFNGVINRIPLKLGSLVEEGALLTTLSDLESIYAYFYVSEKEYLEYMDARRKDSLHMTDEVLLLTADGKKFPAVGEIQTMENEINQSTGSLAFRAVFKNSNLLLKHGSTGKVILKNWIHDVILIPQKAVFEIQDKNYLYLLNDSNKVSIRSIKPIARLGNYYAVKEELRPGDRIVVEGNQTLKENEQVQPVTYTDSILFKY